jgi:hypothetical protein
MDLHARVARLERRNRILSGLVLALAVAAPAGLLIPRLGAADDGKAGAVDVSERLVLRNANGVVAATLVSTTAGANLSLHDAVGRPRMVFAVGKDGPNLVFLDGNQATDNKGVRLALSASEKAGASVSLFGAKGTTPLASTRTKPASGSHPASGAFVAVNEDGRAVAFPRSTKPSDGDESPASASIGAKN